MIQLPSKFILLGSNPTQDSFLLELKFLPISGDLNLAILIHKLKLKLSPQLAQSFIANDSNIEYFNKIAKELIYSVPLSTSQAEYVLLILQKELNNTENNSKQYINVDFNIQPKLTLNLTLQQIFSIHLFISQFIVNYLYFKTEYYKSDSQESQNVEQLLNIPISQEGNVNFQIQSTTSKQYIETKNNILNSKLNEQELLYNMSSDFNFEGILKLIFDICDNNLLIHFIGKYINIQLNNEQIEDNFKIELDNKTNNIHVDIAPLIPNSILSFSKKYYHEIIEIYELLKNTPSEIVTKKMIIIFEAIMNSLKYYLIHKEEKVFEQHLILQILDQLFFIYILLNNNQDYSKHIIYPTYITGNINTSTVNPIQNSYLFHISLNDINQKYINCALQTPEYKAKFNINSVILNHLYNTKYIDYEIQELNILKEIINKNKYILNLKNTELFINNTLDEYSAVTNQEKTIKELSLVYSNGTTLNINQLLNSNVINSSNSLLNYKLLDTSNHQNLSNHSIITEEYKLLLELQYKNNHIDINLIPLIVNKYYQILNDLIFPNLRKQYNTILQPISTIDLLQNYILPFVNEDISISTELKLLYRIIIPFLYDNYKLNIIFDTFH